MMWEGQFRPWSAPREQKLLDQFNAGTSFSDIAAELGVSRSAAIGKAHRMGLKRGHKPGENLAKRPPSKRKAVADDRRRQTNKLRKLTHEAIFGQKMSTDPLPDMHDWLMDRSRCKPLVELGEKDCRWPVGEGPILFCGKEQFGGFKYCLWHCRLAYRRP